MKCKIFGTKKFITDVNYKVGHAPHAKSKQVEDDLVGLLVHLVLVSYAEDIDCTLAHKEPLFVIYIPMIV